MTDHPWPDINGEQPAVEGEALNKAIDAVCELTGERRALITDDARMDHICDVVNRIAALALIDGAKAGRAEGECHG